MRKLNLDSGFDLLFSLYKEQEMMIESFYSFI